MGESFQHVRYELVYNLLQENKLLSKIRSPKIDIFVNLALLLMDGSDIYEYTRHVIGPFLKVVKKGFRRQGQLKAPGEFVLFRATP
jgi:hypothetical protein